MIEAITVAFADKKIAADEVDMLRLLMIATGMVGGAPERGGQNAAGDVLGAPNLFSGRFNLENLLARRMESPDWLGVLVPDLLEPDDDRS